MSNKHNPSATEHFNKLIQFRQAAYACLGSARDAFFELSDAVIDMPAVQSFAELSCSRYFRRGWPSLYEALQDGRPDREQLMRLYGQHMSLGERPMLAGDHTAWPRPTAYTLRDRTVEHQPNPVPGGRPITLGHGYSTLVWVPEKKGSWALPLRHERITSQEARSRRPANSCVKCKVSWLCVPFPCGTLSIAVRRSYWQRLTFPLTS
jgi:hypothetical protein